MTKYFTLERSLKENFLYLKNTVALRVPKDKYMQLILNNTKPLVAPSANPSGAGEILDGNKLAELYKDKADLIINAGILENKMPSTLYDCLENKILRQGSVILNI